MRHRTRGRILNRNMSHRRAMFRNLATSLFAHERIQTTVAKAKELRPFAEKLITIAKYGAESLAKVGNATTPEEKEARAHALFMRRRLIALLGNKKYVIVGNEKNKEEVNVVDKLLKEIGPRFQTRPGGYTRIVKRATARLGDAAQTAFIELLPANEPAKKKSQPAPAVSAE